MPHRIMLKIIGIVFLTLHPLTSHAIKIPIEAWSHDPYISSASLSPNGKKFMAVTLTEANKPPVVSIWETKNLSKPPIQIKPKDSKAWKASWLSNEKVMIIGFQKFDIRSGGKPKKTFNTPTYVANADGTGKVKRFLKNKKNIRGVDIENMLHNEPNKILLNVTLSDFTSEFIKLNTSTMIGKKVFRGGERSSYSADSLGNIATKSNLKTDKNGIHESISFRDNKTKPWEEHFRFYAKDRVGIQPESINSNGTIYVSDNKTYDNSIIRTYDKNTKQLGPVLFKNKDFDIGGLIFDRYISEGEDNLIGYTVDGPSRETHYTNPEWQALQSRIDTALPNTKNTITSYTKDKSLAVISSSSDKESGAFYLLIDGKKILPLGRAFPHLSPDEMSPMSFVKYKARDGLEIPGLLTIPKYGTKPYPTIILPHGGPWARDYLGWDRWAQFLANRGYAVLQPQYRGSEGWGQKLWRAGDREWGQKMQDDKDDGANWLVQQGIADKARLAMFGYSYGGYAAMASVVRPNSPYQCAIAGAGVAELDSFDKATFRNPFNRHFQNPTIAGLSPHYVSEKASIPLLLFHGDRDQRVPVNQSRKMYSKMKSLGKDVQYLEIPDLWHSNPWFPQHHYVMLQKIEDYLAKDCGPGGL